jgi:hypothetical protein
VLKKEPRQALVAAGMLDNVSGNALQNWIRACQARAPTFQEVGYRRSDRWHKHRHHRYAYYFVVSHRRALMRALAVLLTIVCGAALADGVALITADKLLMEADIATITEGRPIRSITPVAINAAALDSDLVTVDIAGKTYRFAGSGKVYEARVKSWFGKAPEGDAQFARNGIDFFGVISLYPNTTQAKIYHIQGGEDQRGALVEYEPHTDAFEVTLETARNRETKKLKPAAGKEALSH